MQTNSKIYLAGHRGLVGTALMRQLRLRGFDNVVTRSHAELDLLDQEAVRRFFEAEKPEYVFLAAARVGGIHANNTYPAEFIHDNLAIQTNVIHQAWRHGVKRLLFLGSSCIYPRECPQPMKEEYLLTGPLEPTNRPYAVAKIAGIEMCWAYNRQYGTKYLAVMPTNLYGPGDNYDLRNSHVLPALIRKFHLAKLAAAGDFDAIKQDETTRGPIPEDLKRSLGISTQQLNHSTTQPKVTAWGTGTPKREFLHSDDMAAACLFLMTLPDDHFSAVLGSPGHHSPGDGGPLPAIDSSVRSHSTTQPLNNATMPPLINIGCGQDQTIRELVYLVKEVVGFTGEVVWDETQPDGTMQKLLDVGRLAALGWQPSTGLREGIAAAYEDYLSSLRKKE